MTEYDSFQLIQEVMEDGSFYLVTEAGPIQGETESGSVQ